MHLELVVALRRAAVEAEPVLEARATTALDRNAEDADVLLFGEELLDLGRRGLGHGHERQDSFLDLHPVLIVATGPALGTPAGPSL